LAGVCDPLTGQCSNPAKVDGTLCNGGTNVCVAGQCTGCAVDAQCKADGKTNGKCVAGMCECTPSTCAALGATCGAPANGCGGSLACNDAKTDGQETDVDCGGNILTCATRCAQGKLCTIASDCAAGLACVDGVCCNSGCGGACQACTAAKKGQGVDGVCGPVAAGLADPKGTCLSLPPITCSETGTCNGAGACATYPNGTTCNPAFCVLSTLTNASVCENGGCTAPIPATQDCTPYACRAAACLTKCTVKGDCALGHTCDPATGTCI
jgi:hypothetical protein